MKRSGEIGRKQKIEQTIVRRGRKENRWTMKITRNAHVILVAVRVCNEDIA